MAEAITLLLRAVLALILAIAARRDTALACRRPDPTVPPQPGTQLRPAGG